MFNRKPPEIKVIRVNDRQVDVIVTQGKKTYKSRFGIANLFPRMTAEHAYMLEERKRPKPTPNSPSPTNGMNEWHVLGCLPTTDAAKVHSAYRKMSQVYHPDHGGSNKSFHTLTEARDKALKQCK